VNRGLTDTLAGFEKSKRNEQHLGVQNTCAYERREEKGRKKVESKMNRLYLILWGGAY